MRKQKQKTIVYLPSVQFDFLTQAPQQTLLRFARNGWKVIYCNWKVSDDIYMEEIEDNFFVCHNLYKFRDECKKNNTIFDIRYTSVPQYVDEYLEIKGKINMFSLYDDFDHWREGEKNAFEKSDIVTTTSDLLYETRKDEYNHPYFFTIKNAVPESYLTHEIVEPDEFKELKRPIIGFIGSIGNWTDTSLMRKIADKYTTVFIGAELDKKCPDNVINLGYIDNKKLVDYYGSLDVGILPFRTTGMFERITKFANPIKMYEYMGVGVPCVSTSWSETDCFDGIVFDSKSDSEFMDNIEKVLDMDKKEYSDKAKLEASNHTWEIRYKQYEKIIDDYCKMKNIRLG